MKITANKQTETKAYILFKFLIGLLFILVGLAEIISKTSYTFRWFDKIEGSQVQIFGAVLALYGTYLGITAARAFTQKKTNETK